MQQNHINNCQNTPKEKDLSERPGDGGGDINAHKVQFCCKGMVIKKMWYRCREIQMDQ